MKLRCILFIGISLLTFDSIALEDPSLVGRNKIEKLSKSWDDLTQEGKNTVYAKVREFIVNALPTDWTWEAIFKPVVDRTNQYYYDKTKNVGVWTAGLATAGAVTYGLYRWASRRGLEGLVKDLQEDDKEHGDILRQLDDKKRDLKSKKGNAKLQTQDVVLAKGIKALITSKLGDLKNYIQQLTTKMNEFNPFITESKSQPKSLQSWQSKFKPRSNTLLNIKTEPKVPQGNIKTQDQG